MLIKFHGAAGGEVTSSCRLSETADKRILFDCGMLQGDRDTEVRFGTTVTLSQPGIRLQV